MMKELTPDELSALVRFAKEFKRIIKEKADEDAHFSETFGEVEINEDWVKQEALEQIAFTEQMDDLFDEIKDKPIDQARYEKRRSVIEQKDRTRYEKSHMPTVTTSN